MRRAASAVRLRRAAEWSQPEECRQRVEAAPRRPAACRGARAVHLQRAASSLRSAPAWSWPKGRAQHLRAASHRSEVRPAGCRVPVASPSAPGLAQASPQPAALPGARRERRPEPVSARVEPSARLQEAAAVAAEGCEPAEPRWAAALSGVQALPQAAASVPDARGPQPAEATAGSDARGLQRAEAAVGSDARVLPQEAVRAESDGPAALPRAAASDAQELRPVAVSARAVLQLAARPGVREAGPAPAWPAACPVPSSPLPSPARRRAAQSARAMLKLRAA